MNFKAFIYSIFSIFLLIGISNASSLENRVTSYFNSLANSLGTSVSSLLSENSRVKYLNLNIGVQDDLKPTVSLTNVNMISQYGNSAIFNQNSLNLHNNDQTINLGIGHRTLLNDDKVIIGLNFNLKKQNSFLKLHFQNTVTNSLQKYQLLLFFAIENNQFLKS